MEFPVALIPGRLIRRYKRFLADVELAGGETATAHCPNPGSMLGLADPGLELWLSPTGGGAGRLPYRWDLVRLPSGLVGINTQIPNRLAAEAIAAGRIPELVGYSRLRREVRYGKNSRIDLLLEADDRPPCYVEVKNVHLRRPGGRHPDAAEFPDSVTARGAKHLAELADMTAAGARTVTMFVVQREDCDHFQIAGDIDPAYQRAIGQALAAGMEVLCYACRVSQHGIDIDRPVPLAL